MKSKYSFYIYCFFSILAGFFYALGFPSLLPYNFFLSPIIGMSLLLSAFPIIRGKVSFNFKHELTFIFLFACTIYFLGYYWIPYTIKEFGNIPIPFNYILGIISTVVIVPHLIVFLLICKFINRFFKNNQNYIYQANIILALILTLTEYFIPQQFPAHVGHAWMQITPYLGLAPFFGIPIYSFFGHFSALTIISAIKRKKIDLFTPIPIIILLIINFISPVVHNPDKEKNLKINNIRLVQANIGNYLKISSEKGDKNSLENVFNTYYQLSTIPPKRPLDLIIWPETAYPMNLESNKLLEFPHLIPQLFRAIMQKMDAQLFLGGYDKAQDFNYDEFETFYNATFFFELDDEKESARLLNTYQKVKLIPFGETLPFGPLNRTFSKLVDNISYFKSGNNFPLFKTRNGSTFIVAICYEVLFPELIRNYSNKVKVRPHFIINLTNDSWYGDSAEPYQHLFLSKWRALEFQVPIIRMTNTGISSIIYPDGSESKRIGLFKEGILDITLKTFSQKPTFFQKWGIVPTLIFSIFLLFISFLNGFRKKNLSKVA